MKQNIIDFAMKNGDLEVKGSAARNFKFSFKKAEKFTEWEFAAYDSYGQDRCDEDDIDTIADLFGQEFSDKFYTAKNVLIHQWLLKEAKKELDDAQKRYEKLLAYVPNPKLPEE